MKFRLEIRDRTFTTKYILDDEYKDLNWSYSRIGGCGEINFELPRKRFEERAISGEYNVRLYYRNPETNSYNLWYQGLIENKIPRMKGNTETIPFQGHGYQSQLSRVYLRDLTYTNLETSKIAAAIVGTYVDPVTDIIYDAANFSTTAFTPSAITFNETALSALTKLAELAGAREWGVDKDRKFFFKARSASIGFRFHKGFNLVDFEENQDFSQVANQVYVQGAQTGGTYHFFGPYNEVFSQSKYGVRTVVLSNSSITSGDVGSQFATSYLDEKKEVSRRASCLLVNYAGLMESTVPINMFAEIASKAKYGQKKWGTGLYSGIVGRVVNRINYMLSNNSALTVRVDLGQLKPNLAEQISGIKYELEQQQQASL